MASVSLLNTLNSLGYSLDIPEWVLGLICLLFFLLFFIHSVGKTLSYLFEKHKDK